MIRQQQSLVMRHHSHLTVEQITSRKVHQSECILVDRVVLDVNAVVLALEITDSHVGRIVVAVEFAGMG